MKHFKLLLASALTLLIALVIATPANAAQDKEIKVSGLEVGDTVTFYQIIEWNPADEYNVGGWVFTEPFYGTDATEKAAAKQLLQKILGDDSVTPAIAQEGITAATAKILLTTLTDELNKLPTDTTRVVPPSKTAKIDVVTDPNDSTKVLDVIATATIDQVDAQNNPTTVDLGVWMGLIKSASVEVLYSPVFVSADFDDANPNTNAIKLPANYDVEKVEDGQPQPTPVAKKSKGGVVKTVAATDGDMQPFDLKNFTWVSDRIGEVESFEVTTTIPAFKDIFTKPVFIIRDNLTFLTLNKTADGKDYDVVVEIATGVDGQGNTTYTALTEGTEYTLNAGDDFYKITFAESYLKTIAAPQGVRVTYKATVSTTAPLHVNLQNNTVSTEFTNNPGDETSRGYWKDDTDHFTFTIDADNLGNGYKEIHKSTHEIVKVGKKKNGEPINQVTITSDINDNKVESYTGPLAGAEFKLYTDANCTTEYIPRDVNGNTLSPAPTYVSGADGRIGLIENGKFVSGIHGLDEGTYYLVETKAPAGYIKSNDVVKFQIKATIEEIDVTEWTTGKEVNGKLEWISDDAYQAITDQTVKAKYIQSYTYSMPILKGYDVYVNDAPNPRAHYTFTNDGPVTVINKDTWSEIPTSIVNVEGTELPSTGGMGTTIFYVVGSALVLCAGVLLVTKRRIARTEA